MLCVFREPDVVGQTPTESRPAPSLLETKERFHAACDAIAATAFREHSANTSRFHMLIYPEIRAIFGLSAHIAVRTKTQRRLVRVHVRMANIQARRYIS